MTLVVLSEWEGNTNHGLEEGGKEEGRADGSECAVVEDINYMDNYATVTSLNPLQNKGLNQPYLPIIYLIIYFSLRW